MKALLGTVMALGLVAFASVPASAECASKNVSADARTMTPIITADTVATPVVIDDKG